MKRIAITGPESTGKSFLAKQLANRYNASLVEEYAREYLEKLNRPYSINDIVEIGKGQMKLEEAVAKTEKNILICDTELSVIKIWCEFNYNDCPDWVEENINKYTYDLYLLCNIDIPWQEDPMREHPDKRKELFEIYHKELSSRNTNFRIIEGSEVNRLENAVKFIDELFTD